MCLSCSGAFCNNPSMLLNTLTSSFLNLFFASFAPIVISNPSTGALFTIFANNRIIFMESPTNRIKEVLAEKGIKQTWLAEKLGKSFCIVNAYVCNRRQPSLEVLFEIADILNIDVKDLIKDR